MPAKSEKTLGEEKAEEQVEASGKALEAAEVGKDAPSDAKVEKAAAKLPVYDEVARIEKAADLTGRTGPVPDTPSGYAVKKVGNLDGEDVDHSEIGATEAARRHGERYQYHKALLRWGPGPEPPE